MRFGPYETPTFKYGDTFLYELRVEMVICGLTDVSIPWPIGKSKERGSKSHSIILFSSLADAVIRETAQAVSHWWGVGRETVWKWQRALEVKRCNEGTHELRSPYAREPAYVAGLEKAIAKACDPVRRAKIARAKQGEAGQAAPASRRCRAVIRAHKGKMASAETRRKMSETHRSRWARPPETVDP